jgi:hypothetical protein
VTPAGRRRLIKELSRWGVLAELPREFVEAIRRELIARIARSPI